MDAQIPQFHFRPRKAVPSKARGQFDVELRRLALARVIEELPLPSALWDAFTQHADAHIDDVDNLYLTYEGYRRAVVALIGEEAFDGGHVVLNGTAFSKHEVDKKAGVVVLFSYLAKKLLFLKLRLQLEVCAASTALASMPSFCGTHEPTVTVDDVEQFIADLMPHLRLGRDCPPWFVPYYLAHAGARVFAMLDDRRHRSIPISRLLQSDALNELLSLYEVDPGDAVCAYPVGCAVEVQTIVFEAARNGNAADGGDDDSMTAGVVVSHEGDGASAHSLYTVAVGSTQDLVDLRRDALFLPTSADAFETSLPQLVQMAGESGREPNWFSVLTALKVYVHFCRLDEDNDGVLSEQEMSAYNRSSYTDLAVARVFQEHVSDGGGLDYKQFIDFTHAAEYPGLVASQRYMWRLLDAMDGGTSIHLDVLRRFCTAVSLRLRSEQLMEISGDSILAELVDMVDPAEVDRLSFSDITRSGHGATVLPLMLDFRCFFNYDSREQQLATVEPAEGASVLP